MMQSQVTFDLDKLWLIAESSKTPALRLIQWTTKEGHRHLGVFRSQEAVMGTLGAIKTHGHPDAAAFRPPSASAWLGFLTQVQEQGIEYVSLDSVPDQPDNWVLIPMADMIKSVRQLVERG